MTLNSPSVTDRAAYLRSEIQRHRDLYYKQAAPMIDDAEYDVLVRELEQFEMSQPLMVQDDSPTQTVGDDRTEGFAKATHTLPMLSLRNVYSKSELFDWYHSIQKALDSPFQLLVSVKIDGTALELVYRDGVLQTAITRGDGIEGDNVTENAKAIGNAEIPHRLKDVKGQLEVRGEIYFDQLGFELANKLRMAEGKTAFANPRNAAAGTLKHQDPKEVWKRGLSFIAHSLGDRSYAALPVTMSDAFKTLSRLGIPIVEYAMLDGPEDAWEWIQEFGEQRADLKYPCDGVVLNVNSLPARERLGATGHSPRWAVAYKYPAEQATTFIRSITVQVGRTGRATPVAELEPVKLAGTTVSRATLHNQDECDRLGVFAGASVVIEKGGEIIPKVVRVEGRATSKLRWAMPPECPECQGELRRAEDEANHYCVNPKCPAKIIGWILHWASRDVMNIQGLGVEIAEVLVRQCGVRTPADLYTLTMRREPLPFGEKTSGKLIAEIDKSKQRSFSCTLDGLGIHGIGTTMSRELIKHFAEIDQLIDAPDEFLLGIPDFGLKTLESLRAWTDNKDNLKILLLLAKAGVRMERTKEETPVQMEKNATNHPFFGKTLVFTGTLSMDRSAAETLAMTKGAKCSGSVSKKTDLVIAGPGAGSKLAKAEQLGVEVIDEIEFTKRLNGYR